MVNQLSFIIYIIVIFILYSIILWQISKKQKLRKQDFKTAVLIIGITFIIILPIILISQLITLNTIIKIFISILTFFITPFLIKKFYKINWLKSIKVYFLMFLITFAIIFVIAFIFSFLITMLTPFLKWNKIFGRLEKRKRKGIIYYIEKATDINLALDLVLDAQKDIYDKAFLISNDGDFSGAVSSAINFKKKVIYVAIGNKKVLSHHLEKVSTSTIKINKAFILDVKLLKK